MDLADRHGASSCVIGVPAALVGYIVARRARPAASCPSGGSRACGRGCGSLPALLFLGVFLVYPTIATIIRSLPGQDSADPQFIGLDNYQCFFSTGDTLIALRNNVLWLVLLTAFVVVGSACSSPSCSTASAMSRSPSRCSSCRSRSASSAPASSGSSCTTTSSAGAAQIGTLNGPSIGVRWQARRPSCRRPPAEHDLADHRGGLDLDRLRHGHPVGRPQGHQRRAARGRPRRRRQRARRSSGASRCRCCCRRSPSSRRR